MGATLNLSTIDFQSISTPAEQAKLKAACETHGFFALINHGIAANSRRQFLSEMTRFFTKPLEHKLAFERSANNPFGFYNKELTKNRPDWKEVFDISLSAETPTNWPDDAHFREVNKSWSEQCHHVGIALLKAIFASLDLPYRDSDFDPAHTSFLRLNYYPPCPKTEKVRQNEVLGVSHHTDAGAITLLQQDEIEGLQFLVEGKWHTSPADPEALFVNLGDMLQVWTNDIYRAPLHRVLANTEQPRFSAPYFLNPDYACDCAPLIGEKPVYQTVNWGEFRRRRADGDYADYGEEVQISQYRL